MKIELLRHRQMGGTYRCHLLHFGNTNKFKRNDPLSV